MHVLVAAHDFYPDPESGGTGRYVAETARHLVRRRHSVSVLTRRRGGVPERETIDGVDVYRYEFAVAGRPFPEILAQLPRARRDVLEFVEEARASEGPIDTVSNQGPVTATLVDHAVPSEVPRLTTLHSPWPTEYRLRTRNDEGMTELRRSLNTAIRRRVEKRLLAKSDHIVTLSDFMRMETRRVYDHDVTTSVIPGGVDASRFRPEGPTHARVEGDPAFLTVRRLSERMGHRDLLRAFASVTENHTGARLYVAGDGPLRETLEETTRELGIEETTTFLGYVPREDLPAVYRSADVFVLPTTELEGFGLATLEALASGLPVVATPVGGTVEVLSGLENDSAMPISPLVEAASTEALSEGMEVWASVSTDQHAKAASRCRRYAHMRYPWRRTVSRLEELYEDVSGIVAPSQSRT